MVSDMPVPQSTPVPLEVHDLTIAYRHTPVVYGVDFVVPAGQMVGIIGPNGAGKSTLLRGIMGLLPLSNGWVQFFGDTLARSRRRIGYVPQRESVDWDFPVCAADVVLMGRYGHMGLWQRPSTADQAVAAECLAMVGMQAFAGRQIGELSGGQQQRVFLARALAQRSDLYLLDEPFAGVDAATETIIIQILRQLRDQGKTILAVHHDLPTARQYFDRLLLLNQHRVAYGPTAEVFTYDNLQRAYGGRLTLLSSVAALRLEDPPKP
jgi:manganese/zinc/iron transport system ATP- binding protein